MPLTLPRLTDPNTWRQRRDAAKRQRKSSAYEQRMMELSVAQQLRREIREDRKIGKSS